MSIPDYRELIDSEVWHFIEVTEQWHPADAVSLSIEEQRSVYSAMCNEFSFGHPDGVSTVDDTVSTASATVPVRRYASKNTNALAHIVYLHGGGFILGDLESHDDVCAELCAQTSLCVTAVDYRLAPEHKHPAAFDDCLAVVLHEAALHQLPIILCGDSSGGNLCAAVSHQLRSNSAQSKILAQVLIYPGLGGDALVGEILGEDNLGRDPKNSSYRYHANAPLLSAADMKFYQSIRVEGEAPRNDVSFAPLCDTDFSNLPNTLVLSAECDPLSDDGKHYSECINRAGGRAIWRHEHGLVHGYLRARHTCRRAAASFDAITLFIIECANALQPD